MTEKVKKDKSDQLRDTYLEFGETSNEFVDACRYYVVFVLNRHCCQVYESDIIEGLKKVIDYMPKYDPKRKLHTFLYGVIRNVASQINSRRKRNNKYALFESFQNFDVPVPSEVDAIIDFEEEAAKLVEFFGVDIKELMKNTYFKMYFKFALR